MVLFFLIIRNTYKYVMFIESIGVILKFTYVAMCSGFLGITELCLCISFQKNAILCPVDQFRLINIHYSGLCCPHYPQGLAIVYIKDLLESNVHMGYKNVLV